MPSVLYFVFHSKYLRTVSALNLIFFVLFVLLIKLGTCTVEVVNFFSGVPPEAGVGNYLKLFLLYSLV